MIAEQGTYILQLGAALKLLRPRDAERLAIPNDERGRNACVPTVHALQIVQDNRILIPASFNRWGRVNPALDMAPHTS